MSGPAKGRLMELLTMSPTEVARLLVLQEVRDRVKTPAQASIDLGLGGRQLRRLLRRFESEGLGAVVSKRRGRPPNNRLPDALRSTILDRCRGEYRGFGPTFLAEVLRERDGVTVSREWLRALLVENGLWKSKGRKRNTHPLRTRRPCFGELIQMDGSPHDWFEGRGPRSTLLLAIDDATSFVTAGRFEESETSDGYFRLITNHIKTFGRFCAAYTDKHSIFRYSGPESNPEIATQMQRALDELQIQLICANSPQAKGRIERANRTFQDRLVHAMRLEGIASREAGNTFLTAFIADHNSRFAIEPAEPQDAHRSSDGFDLQRILCRREERTVTKNLMFQIDDACFTLTDPYSRRNLTTGSRVELQMHPDRPMTVHHDGTQLVAEAAGRLVRNAPIVGSKDLNAYLDRRLPNPKKAHTPAVNHPWRRSRLSAPTA